MRPRGRILTLSELLGARSVEDLYLLCAWCDGAGCGKCDGGLAVMAPAMQKMLIRVRNKLREFEAGLQKIRLYRKTEPEFGKDFSEEAADGDD